MLHADQFPGDSPHLPRVTQSQPPAHQQLSRGVGLEGAGQDLGREKRQCRVSGLKGGELRVHGSDVCWVMLLHAVCCWEW